MPPPVAIHMRDYIFMIALIGCTLIVFSNWASYDKCSDPLHIWLVTNFLAFVVFRVIQFLFQWSVTNRSRQGRFLPNFLAFVNLWLIYPFLWVWTILGTIWYVRSGTDCLPQDRSHFWFIAWLVYSFVYLIAFAGLIFSTFRAHRENQDLDQFQAILGSFQRPVSMGFQSQNSRTGLTDEELDAIPVKIISETDLNATNDTCSICLVELSPGDSVRDLVCSHYFHQSCLDQWLHLKDSCPNCVQRITTENSGLLEGDFSDESDGSIRSARGSVSVSVRSPRTVSSPDLRSHYAPVQGERRHTVFV